jgi:hypothetical protein
MGISNPIFGQGANVPEEGDSMSLMRNSMPAIEKAYDKQ